MADSRRDHILAAALPVLGHYGLKKTSVNDLARAAGISKQGLYLHFDSKDELLREAMHRYFEEGLSLVGDALGRSSSPLQERLIDALDAWFGRHIEYFNPSTLEVIEPTSPAANGIDEVKRKVLLRLEQAIASADEAEAHCLTPAELAQVLFQFGLTWKEGHLSRVAYRETVRLCVYACFPRASSSKSNEKRKRSAR